MQMTDQQMLQMTQQWQDKLTKRFEDLQLRRWCIERAIEAVKTDGSPLLVSGPDQMVIQFAVVHLADHILKFITAPFAETFAPASEREPDHHQV